MTTATLAINRIQEVQKNLPSVNWKAVCCAGFSMMVVLLIFYVWQINDLTRGSYIMNFYENQISKLSDENKNLQVSFAESSFLGQALTKIQAMNFQKTTSVKYVQIMDSVATIQK